mgnify:FL=1
MDMLVSGESSPAEVSDKIKEILYTKASDKVDSVKPQVAGGLFGDEEPNEVVDEVESEEDEEETQTGDEE